MTLIIHQRSRRSITSMTKKWSLSINIITWEFLYLERLQSWNMTIPSQKQVMGMLIIYLLPRARVLIAAVDRLMRDWSIIWSKKNSKGKVFFENEKDTLGHIAWSGRILSWHDSSWPILTHYILQPASKLDTVDWLSGIPGHRSWSKNLHRNLAIG